MSPEQYLTQWQHSQADAESMYPLIGKLYREKGVDIHIYGRAMVTASTIDVVKAHRVARWYTGQEVTTEHTLPLLQALSNMDLPPCRVDLGRLASLYWSEHEDDAELEGFLERAVADLPKGNALDAPRDVVLYGFGRIGRLVTRLMIEKSGPGYPLRLRAIVVRGGRDGDLEKRASLLRRDSVHGPFNGSILVDEARNALIVNGNYIQVIYANHPSEVDYTAYGIENAVVVDNTGMWRDTDGLGQHLTAQGAGKVLLTAPGKGDIKNIVYGVNQDDIDDADTIISAASCTTNAITPVLKAMHDRYGVESGHIETVHSFTNDQNLIDNFHSGDRRGRAASLNMVLTSTGAATAVAKALPALKGKLTGNSIRVPTPNVSMAIANLNLGSEVERESLNAFLRDTALVSELAGQVDYTQSTEIVSSDIVGSRYAGVVDSEATIADGNRCVLYIWYDNEFGYSCQVIHCIEHMAGLRYPMVPTPQES
ncbi:glyceraldehyde-3-phosphate dehydrogenase [Enterovibrio norvegicus]|uniref:glyceraldehyde-3-phosphate dehydrogenase n=1 Tax=Enterovibrio norvegicus TaxID=188144 RepID=UPI000C8626B0|nr:glyceraldehyde-3-phosphate dehydrogenase [Enterovibrio norvegicus]PMN72154.1 type I glyceraldehyde-3-phosphate dehydrogenase [Enterovibrio norvegicus]